ncbi:MAG: ABC transporter permease [Anaerolineales bacterium]
MNNTFVVDSIRSVVAASAPLVFAGIGETLTEKAGVVNLSLDGTILLSAMAGFAIAFLTNSLLLGFLMAMAVGAVVAFVVAYGSIALKQNQIAVGFTLTLLCGHLSSFLGNPFVRRPGPSVPHMPIPGLVRLPLLGPALFDQDIIVYLSYLTIVLSWLWVFRTRAGLRLRGVGEQPASAFARGVDVHRTRYVYSLVGGALVGLAGSAYSLSVKLGWSHGHTTGLGWIALAIVIFGGWSPLRVAFGAYLFGALKSLGSILQPVFPRVPTQVFQAAPFALMIVALLLVSGNLSRLLLYLPPSMRPLLAPLLRGAPPAALGQPFEQA